MKPRKTSLLAAMLTILFSVSSWAQDCQPSGKFTDKEGEAGTIAAGETYAGSAPLTVTFSANPPSGHDPATNYEWHFFNQNNPREAYLIRYDEDTEYIFTEAGTTRVVLYEILNGDTTRYNAINVSISESSLQMPNAFSPNGDGINDVYRAKPGYKSIVSFKAVIFNRWGQKLYEWDDPAVNTRAGTLPKGHTLSMSLPRVLTGESSVSEGMSTCSEAICRLHTDCASLFPLSCQRSLSLFIAYYFPFNERKN